MKGSCYVIISFVLVISAISCKKTDDSKGFSDDIKNFVPDSTIQSLRDMGMSINEGKNPPDIEGYYLVKPMVMKASSVPGETQSEASVWYDQRYHVYNQNNDALTVDVEIDGLDAGGNVRSHSLGKGTFISGNDDYFSTFTIQEGEEYFNTDTAYYKWLEVVSGMITEDGIRKYQMALLMLDDYDDPYDIYIPVNTGRVFVDGDSLAERTSAELKLLRIKSDNRPVIHEAISIGRK
ncbi:hypothetical protein [Saccharicrinis sp. FJH54]|uniref:hypothetical protein n=1 Tax=Saccharicrinis sp. FJH54 TaxID=3344665 RepID=UPI0035D4BA24